MENILTTWMTSWFALRFIATRRHAMDELTLGTSYWSDRSTRQSMQMLSTGFLDDRLDDGQWPDEPVLPTPTDVPVPEPFDVPVPEPMDIPPPDPRDVPPPRPDFDPKPSRVP